MNTPFKKLVQDTSLYSQQLLEIYGHLQQINILWAGSPEYQNLVTQEQIDSDPGYSAAGLTTQNIADAEFALAQVKNAIEAGLVPLTILANLPPQ